jgi:hypothetical protein
MNGNRKVPDRLPNLIVLVILDRNVDLIPMLSHSWTYQALVHDVLEMKLNRVTVEVSCRIHSQVV